MKIEIDNEIHEVVYIDYSKGNPHTVTTIFYVPNAGNGAYWRTEHWDFFMNNGDKDDLYAYSSGSGGSVQAPCWIDGYVGHFWLKDGYKMEGEPKNYKQLKNPKRIKNFRGNSINPFKVAEITHSYEYCEKCEESSIDICWEHIYEDENDNYELKYKEDNSPYS